MDDEVGNELSLWTRGCLAYEEQTQRIVNRLAPIFPTLVSFERSKEWVLGWITRGMMERDLEILTQSEEIKHVRNKTREQKQLMKQRELVVAKRRRVLSKLRNALFGPTAEETKEEAKEEEAKEEEAKEEAKIEEKQEEQDLDVNDLVEGLQNIRLEEPNNICVVCYEEFTEANHPCLCPANNLNHAQCSQCRIRAFANNRNDNCPICRQQYSDYAQFFEQYEALQRRRGRRSSVQQSRRSSRDDERETLRRDITRLLGNNNLSIDVLRCVYATLCEVLDA